MFSVLSIVELRRVYPCGSRWKRSIPPALAVALLAGCGGGGGGNTTTAAAAAGQLLLGTGFSVRAPDGWSTTVRPTSVQATQAGELVGVIVLPLLKTYRPSLFRASISELNRTAAGIASRTKGTVVASRTVVVAGGRARQYDVQTGGTVVRYTFVLRGKREYQLTCRWQAADGLPDACAQLVASFSFR
jgi:hypothetical protein